MRGLPRGQDSSSRADRRRVRRAADPGHGARSGRGHGVEGRASARPPARGCGEERGRAGSRVETDALGRLFLVISAVEPASLLARTHGPAGGRPGASHPRRRRDRAGSASLAKTGCPRTERCRCDVERSIDARATTLARCDRDRQRLIGGPGCLARRISRAESIRGGPRRVLPALLWSARRGRNGRRFDRPGSKWHKRRVVSPRMGAGLSHPRVVYWASRPLLW
jgi:hypothetical protein